MPAVAICDSSPVVSTETHGRVLDLLPGGLPDLAAWAHGNECGSSTRCTHLLRDDSVNQHYGCMLLAHHAGRWHVVAEVQVVACAWLARNVAHTIKFLRSARRRGLLRAARRRTVAVDTAAAFKPLAMSCVACAAT